MPPISAWCPREATKNRTSSPPVLNTGVITVMSGRWVPPWYGSLTAYTSPGFMPLKRRRITSLTVVPIEPRCTGMCGALATRLPSGSNSAQENPSRSRMFTDWAVASSRKPICSAIDMNRLLKISNSTGSASKPASKPARVAASGRGGVTTRCASRCPVSVIVACQPSSTTVVALASAMIAGPVSTSPGRIASLRRSGASRHNPFE
ncbi:Uncharacterised protein [Mycobacterium tuberculosis]|nr:Uncharacterised protein [Mycobacterium tuberculosis]